uniref:60S ribosomal protein L34 n=1 Tax=Brassica campestris TaxID=3711 RepID=M4EW82_BRACM
MEIEQGKELLLEPKTVTEKSYFCTHSIATVAVPKAFTRRREAKDMHMYADLTNHLSILFEDGVITMSTNKATKEKKADVHKEYWKIPHLRPTEYIRSRLSRNQRTVKHAYGGALSRVACRQRIVRAFLVEEQKIVKKF